MIYSSFFEEISLDQKLVITKIKNKYRLKARSDAFSK